MTYMEARTIIPKAHTWTGAKHDDDTCPRCVAKRAADPVKARQYEAYKAWKATREASR